MLDTGEAEIRATREITERLITEFYIKAIGFEAEPDRISEEKVRGMVGRKAFHL